MIFRPRFRSTPETRVALSRVTNGRAAVSAEMALRMQAAYDLWRASRKRRPKIPPLKLAA